METGLYDAWRVYDNTLASRQTQDGRESRGTTLRIIKYNLERLKEFGCFTETRYAGKEAWQPTRRYNVLVQELAASRLYDEVMRIKNGGNQPAEEFDDAPLEPVSADQAEAGIEDWGREFRDESVEIDPLGDAVPRPGDRKTAIEEDEDDASFDEDEDMDADYEDDDVDDAGVYESDDDEDNME